jgi:hypothetical protein
VQKADAGGDSIKPMFESRWRWNATRSLMLDACTTGRNPFRADQRMRAGDLLAASFPAAIACPENLAAGRTWKSRWITRSCADDRRLPARSDRHRRP